MTAKTFNPSFLRQISSCYKLLCKFGMTVYRHMLVCWNEMHIIKLIISYSFGKNKLLVPLNEDMFAQMKVMLTTDKLVHFSWFCSLAQPENLVVSLDTASLIQLSRFSSNISHPGFVLKQDERQSK